MRKSLTPVARRLRNEMTEAEKRLWSMIRFKSLGVKFRRQAIIGKYIIDYVCFKKKLILEVDGGQHCESQEDILRDKWLRSQGFEVLRFWNNDVLGDMDGVYQRIEEHLRSPLPYPSPQGGGKEGGVPHGGEEMRYLNSVR